MTAAYRMKGLGWFGGCVVIALGFYLVSLQIAAERKKLEDVNGRIRSAERDIRALETEFDTRANLVQLEKWNGDTLALASPTAGQFVASEAQLAAMDVTSGTTAETMTAALVVPALVQPAAPTPLPAATLPPAATLVQVAAATPLPAAPAGGPRIIKASVVRTVEPVAAAPKSGRALAKLASAVRASAAVAKVRPQAVALLDKQLLSDSTLGDILSGARHESGRRN